MKLPPLPESSPVGISLASTDQNLLNAIEALCKIVGSRNRDAGRLAARTDWILWCCILQRKENIWAADDPLAAAADRARSEFRERACAGESLDADSECDLRAAAQCDYLRGRELEDNAPAAAAEWREWRRIADLLQIEIDRYPKPADAVTFENDLKRLERNELDPL